jgi:hypothetical protein
MWQVELTKKPRVNDFRDDYFPRKTYYKADALKLQKEVEDKGGEALVVRVSRSAKKGN